MLLNLLSTKIQNYLKQIQFPVFVGYVQKMLKRPLTLTSCRDFIFTVKYEKKIVSVIESNVFITVVH
jgi:hypothetical protein